MFVSTGEHRSAFELVPHGYARLMHALADRELDPLPFLVLGLAMLGIGLLLG